MLTAPDKNRATMAFGFAATPLLFALSLLDMSLLAAGAFLLLAAAAFAIRNQRTRDCPRCGARLSNFFGDRPQWLQLAFSRFCPECGWDADSHRRRLVPARRRP